MKVRIIQERRYIQKMYELHDIIFNKLSDENRTL
jgi:hypothetical protein